MNAEQFIKKYGRPEFGEYWLSGVCECYWAASYGLIEKQLIEMSKDLLRISHAGNGNSSINLALQILNKYDRLDLMAGQC
jgi:hypothetical protein